MRKRFNFSRIVAGTVGIAMALSMVSGFGMNNAGAQSAADLQAQIEQLLATIQQLQAQLASLQGGGAQPVMSSVCPFTWTRNLTIGATGMDVMNLQKFLNSDTMTMLASSGAGSPGAETEYFGPITKNGAKMFQEKYASEILTPLGLTAGTGFVGASTRAKLNMLCATAPLPVPPPPTIPPPGGDTDVTPLPTAGGLSVSKSTNQPENSLAVKSAARVPFTRVTFTAGASDVVIDSLVVERTGLSNDTNFSGIVLIDENNNQIGLAKTLNANHQVTLNEKFTVKAGQARTMTIAGNMAASPNSGEVASLDLVAVNTSSIVSGTLPIRGATHTVNDQLSIGTGAMSVGALDPNAALTKDIGTTGFTFASVRLTAGTNEKVRIRSIRWNQTGSASDSDMANLKTRIDGVDYAMTIDSTGKYYTAHFGDGIVVDKGAQKEMSVRGDVTNGSNRTIVFDIHKDTDVYVTGELYGFGIIVTQSQNGTAVTTSSQFTSGTPFFDGSHTTIGTGSLTVKKSISVAGQNVSENVLNTPIAAFDMEAKGETISVGQMDFFFGITGTGNGGDMTSISLYDANGSAVAGPVDAALVSGSNYRVRFTDTVDFPVGINTYTLKGKYGTDFANNDTIIASTTPSTDFSTVTGRDTGDTITPTPSSAVTGPTMTIKAPAITASVSSIPVAQTIVAGNPFVFATYQLDATDSGDDMQFSNLKLDYEVVSGVATNITGCTLLDGSTELTTGSNRVNPTASANNTNFNLDSPLVVPKGTLKNIDLRCGTTATSSGQQFRWGLETLANAANQATGVNSNTTISTTADFTVNSSVGQTITLGTGGSYSVVDDNTPGYSIVTPGTDATLLKLKFTASQESMNVKRVAFQLGSNTPGSTATNTPKDLVAQKITLWDGATMVGEAIFANNGDRATSTLSGLFQVPSGSSKTMTVKGTISAINKDTGPLTNSGDLIVVSWDADDRNTTTPSSGGNYASGASGGTSVAVDSGSDVTPTGMRIMRAYPKFTKIALSSSEKVLQTGSDRILFKYQVEAMGGDVGFTKFTFEHSSSTGGGIASATTSKYSLYVYTDSQFSTRDSTFTSAGGTPGLLNSNQCYGNENSQTVANTVGIAGTGIEIWVDKTATACGATHTAFASTTYKVPSGQSRWFEFRANVASVENVSGSESFEVKLRGDAAYPTNIPSPSGISGSLTGVAMGKALAIDGDTNDDLIWTPISTTTSQSLEDLDWTNGYFVPGLPGSDMSPETLISAN
jgi:hypothetical protein